MVLRLAVAAATVLFAALTADAQSIDWSRADAAVEAATQRSPALAALSADIRAARERIGPAGSLPNPMVMAGVQNESIDFSADDMTMYMVGASQTITRRPRREALRTAAQLDVSRLERELDARRAEIEREVRFAWYDAGAAQNQIGATEEIVRLAKSTVESARFRYEAGTAAQADLIRAMLEESDLQHQLLALKGRRNQAVAKLAALLQISAKDIPSFVLTEGMSHMAAEHEMSAALPRVTAAIAALEADVQRADQDIRLAKLLARPDWSVEASYGLRPMRTDMFSVIGRIELPYRRNTLIAPRVREAEVKREAAVQQIAARRQQLEQDLGVALAVRDEANAQLALHVDRLVPEARTGFESSLSSYQTGKATFDTVLGSLTTLLRLNVDYYDFLRQLREAEADIDAIVRGARSGALAGSATPSAGGMR